VNADFISKIPISNKVVFFMYGFFFAKIEENYPSKT